MVKSLISSAILRLFIFVIFITVYGTGIHSQVGLKGLVLLIDFADDPMDLPLERVDSLMNGITYTEDDVPHTIRNYYLVQSRDSISLTHEIFGYYRAPETAAWYADQEWPIVYDLLTDALDSMVAQNPDFDWDQLSINDKPWAYETFLSINVVTTAWVAGSGGTHYLPDGDWVAPNGVKVRAFTSQALTSPWDPTFVRLFVIAHEIGHAAWGFPDTYDYDGSSFGTGFYSVMSGNQLAGEVEPIGGPFFVDAGWASLIDIEPNGGYTLPMDGKLVARYVNPSNPNEYFLIEACKNSTPGNAAFPVEKGLVIWHIDDDVTTFNTLENRTLSEHYKYSIEQKDGLFDLENGVNQGDAGDIYVEGSLFSASTNPNSNWWNDAASGLNINSIELLDDNTIRFCNGTCVASTPGNKLENSFQVYDNNKGELILQTVHAPSDNYTVEIINMLGAVVVSETFNLNDNQGTNTFSFSLAGLSSDLYIVRLIGQETELVQTKKISLN